MFSLGSLVPLLETCKLGVRRLIGDSKLPRDTNVSVDGCLSRYVGPAMNW